MALQLACEHWQTAAARAAFAGWRQGALLLHAKQQAAMRAVSWFRSAQLHRAFAGWLDAVTSIQAKRGSAMRAVCSMRLFHARRAFTTWRAVVASKQERLDAARRVLVMVTHRSLSLAFRCWRDRTQRECDLRQTAQRAIMMLTQRSLCLAFRSWRAAAARKREQQATALRVLSAMRSSALHRAFIAWQQCGAWLRDSGTKMDACLRVRLVHSSMQNALQDDFVCLAAACCRACHIPPCSMQRLLPCSNTISAQNLPDVMVLVQAHHLHAQRMRQAQLASAFDGWVSFTLSTRESMRRRAIMRTCAARLRNRVMAAAYGAWTNAAAQRAHWRQAAAVALRHWELSAAAAAFATWRDDAAEQLGTAAALSHHRLRILRVAFDGIRREAVMR